MNDFIYLIQTEAGQLARRIGCTLVLLTLSALPQCSGGDDEGLLLLGALAMNPADAGELAVDTDDGEVAVPTGSAPPPEESVQTDFGSTEPDAEDFVAQVYFLPNNTSTVTVIDSLAPEYVPAIYTSQIQISPRAFDSGFPGIENRVEWFGVRYTGTYVASRTGTLHFRINSDDGSILRVDGSLVVDNDGTHAPRARTGSLAVVAGQSYSLELLYFQGPRNMIALELDARFDDEASFSSFDIKTF